ncbi:MAG: AAA family ATPase [Paludibacteraceae bacterium]|nr:AAA family ATPase [Paludibacteraceae bacterium]
MDGVFKEFCGRAMQKSSIVGFGPIYDSFLESLGEKRITIKSQQGKSFAVSVNSKGNLNLMTGDGLQPNGVLTRKEIETEFLKLQKNYLGEDNDNIVKYPNGWEDFFLSKEWVDKIIRIQTTSRFSNDNRLTTLKICRLVADIIQDDNVKYYRQEIEHAFSLKYGPKNESTKSWLITDIQQQINEGLKDNMDNNNGENARKGYYKAVAQYLDDKYNQEKGETCSDKLFVFIIDEINRGEISKIFGELFFSIDPGYRGEKGRVQTQYQNMVEEGDLFKKGFFVPENVYIIGTMNDIDRSVESMDFAFRRRFAFVEVKANENTGMLDGKTWKDDAIKRMNSLNAEIEKIDGLSSAYHIGASYFLKLDNYNGDWSQLWEYHLDGLLREYLRGTQGVDENMKRLENAYNLENATDDSNSNNG